MACRGVIDSSSRVARGRAQGLLSCPTPPLARRHSRTALSSTQQRGKSAAAVVQCPRRAPAICASGSGARMEATRSSRGSGVIARALVADCDYIDSRRGGGGVAWLAGELMEFTRRDWIGMSIAGAITALWFLTFGACLLWIPWEQLSVAAIVAGVLVRTFVHTGVFITVHDAIHGSITPSSPRINHAIGGVLSFIYASFPYKVLRESHHRHHRHPGVAHSDPDFHTSNPHVLAWFCAFMKQYATFKQLFLEAAQTYLLAALAALATGRAYVDSLVLIVLFWALPALLSAIQLFVFGTYLPHRNADHGTPTRSSDWPVWLSFLSCYFFGYHEAHHTSPSTPWFQLPQAHRAAKAEAAEAAEAAQG